MNGMLSIFNMSKEMPVLITAPTKGGNNKFINSTIEMHIHNGVSASLNKHCKDNDIWAVTVKRNMKDGLTVTQAIDKAVAEKGKKPNSKRFPYKDGESTVAEAAKDYDLKNTSYIHNTMNRKKISLQEACEFLAGRQSGLL